MKSHARFEVTGRRPDGGLQDDNNQLLFTRAQTAVLLGNCSLATIRRLEEKGSLKRVRLTQCPTGRVYFTRENVFEVIEKAGKLTKAPARWCNKGNSNKGNISPP